MGYLIKEMLASAFANTLGCLVGYPLDTIKVRMQFETGTNTSFMSCVKKTIRMEGVSLK